MILGNKKERFDLETRKPKNLDLQNLPASSKVIAAILQPKRFQIIAKPPQIVKSQKQQSQRLSKLEVFCELR